MWERINKHCVQQHTFKRWRKIYFYVQVVILLQLCRRPQCSLCFPVKIYSTAHKEHLLVGQWKTDGRLFKQSFLEINITGLTITISGWIFHDYIRCYQLMASLTIFWFEFIAKNNEKRTVDAEQRCGNTLPEWVYKQMKLPRTPPDLHKMTINTLYTIKTNIPN